MRKCMKNSKGITLITLVITIIMLSILGSVATYTGVEVVKSAQFTAFKTEMKIMQTQINEIYQNWKDGKSVNGSTGDEILNLGKDINSSSTVKNQANKVFTANASGITQQEGYRYFDQSTIQSLGIEGVEGEFFVNIEARKIISYQGFTYKGVTYYTLEQLPNELYNVEYEDRNTGNPTFKVDSEKISDNKWKITISNIQYDGYINKWEVRYQKEGQDYWNTSEDLSFIITGSGKYNIELRNNDVFGKGAITIKDGVIPGEVVLGSNKEYSDGTDTAMIPEGFKVSDKEGESTISTGLVVIGPDGSEFVWVPVDDINSMAQCSTAGGSCNLQLQDGHLKCTTHNSEEMVGKLYATNTLESFGTVNTTYNANSGLREPAYLTDEDYGDASSYNTIGLTLEGLKNEYKLMVESVAKYGGFYVGRYETSLSTATETEAGTSGTVQSKAGVIPTAAVWYGLYDKAKTYVASSVQSSMIWGSQYDAMLNWALDGADKDKVTTKGIGNNSSGSVTTAGNGSYRNDSINHIRDLGGNLAEWTLEASGTNYRVYRGGCCNGIDSPSYRNDFYPDETSASGGSRLTLYIQ